jgi:hypothetical protein
MVRDSECWKQIEAAFSKLKDSELWEVRQDDFLFGKKGDYSDWDMDLESAHGKWHDHVWAYKAAADNLVSVILCGPGWLRDYIDVYPVLALYRHYVEIALKELIVSAAVFNDVSVPKLETHVLTNLWARAVSMVKGGEGDDPGIEWELIGEYVAKVDAIPYDLGRYPWTREKADVQLPNKYINLIQLQLFMTRLGSELEAITNWLRDLEQYRYE